MILLTGATGYVGGRLLPKLEQRDGQTPWRVRCLVRDPAALPNRAVTTELTVGDSLDTASLERALAGVHTAFYLIHSMAARADFAATDRQAAQNFARVAAAAGVHRIVYLGGIHQDSATQAHSAHLDSRAETGDLLRSTGVPVVELRSSIIIGAGSLSFEMIRRLVDRLPIMICPRWIRTPTQPIGIDDVLSYLLATLQLPEDAAGIYEIGGPEVMSYGDLLRRYAAERGLRRWMIPVPILSPRISALWLALVTPTQARVGRALVEGLRVPTIVSSTAARRMGVVPRPINEAIEDAIADTAGERLFSDVRERIVDAPPARVFAEVRSIGGRSGWHFGNGLWQIRGWMDRVAGGVGMSRGRPHPERCAAGDVIDWWVVEAVDADRRLRLSAEMKLPGKGWLEFETLPVDGGERTRLVQRAVFEPHGLAGWLYWRASGPLHALLFRGLINRLARRATVTPHAVFCKRSIFPVPAAQLFAWHERPEALEDLLPRTRLVRVVRRAGTIKDGVVTLHMGVWPLRLTWEALHFGYERNVQFSDVQVRGPFRLWRHTHRVEALDVQTSALEDRVEFELPGGALVHLLGAGLMQRLLAKAFAERHAVTLRGLTNRDGGAAGTGATTTATPRPRLS